MRYFSLVKPLFRRKIFVIVSALFVSWYVLRPLLFGNNESFRGGLMGRLVDSLQRLYVFHQTKQKRLERLNALGVHLPRFEEQMRGKNPVLTQDTLAESLTRYAVRAKRLTLLEQEAHEFERKCRDSTTKASTKSMIPNVILQPTVSSWLKPIQNMDSASVLSFDESQMAELIEEHFADMLQAYQSIHSIADRVHLWSICALYFYGGYFFGESIQDASPILDELVAAFPDLASHLVSHKDSADRLNKQQRQCSETGVVLLSHSGTTSWETLLFAITPRHPFLKCAMKQLVAQKQLLDTTKIISSLIGSETWTSFQSPDSAFTSLKHCPCKINDDGRTNLHVRVSQSPNNPKTQINNQLGEESRVDVEITESVNNIPKVKSSKVSLFERMTLAGAVPGWTCGRCLRTKLYGSFAACSTLCPTGYEELMYSNPGEQTRERVKVHVYVRELRPRARGEKLIPRIIHQTWSEHIHADHYPQLVRLSNTWKNAGWAYRFYTDEAARDFILHNFPERFLDAYDALIPGAYKADLFRYLILLKVGGVYADVDTMLETNLETFITPSMSFFVPRDLVADFAEENFCLWNGLMGAAPGHPFLVRSVERLVNMITNRADLYDMEREICYEHGQRSTEIWKTRVMPEVLLSGPCALGVAVNSAIGHNSSLEKFIAGWLPQISPESKYHDQELPDTGDALLLMADKADQGAFRFTDVERNIVVGSTDLPSVSKTPMQTSLRSSASSVDSKGGKHHYTESTWHEEAWGTFGVYKDDLVSNEQVKLELQFE